jgi:predicted nucleic acid-binding protein
VYELIVDEARNLIRQPMVSHLSLQVADAIHLATAIRVEAAELQTYDRKLLNPEYQRITGLTIREPFAAQPPLPGH